MRRLNERGHATALVVVVGIAVTAAALWGWGRVHETESLSLANQRRAQLVWLTRSAAMLGVNDVKTTLAGGPATVAVRPAAGAKPGEKRVRADATGPAGTATLVLGTTAGATSNWTESFERAGSATP